ncbi:MAG: 2-C-methyl-D-erythritol 2,4-cyclodiphosphate synthase [Syntrophales bacterium]|jgi:2-C-methyl-D-erythritol 2,4-cyclodiphosphate synthase|nr:2-C-methyl-D-erythritol 2,4-cyclodiphosphate synthase [Syntrophales bacterium]
MRIGFGYDSHRLVSGRRLVLGGVELSHAKGLVGHSDADALVHAVCDAVIGAVAAGDIGRLFPDTDPAYRDISSLRLLEKVRVLAEDRGFRVRNVDSTVVLEKPKLQGHICGMANNIADALGIAAESVNIKAKTNEGMGFVGREEGVAAYAVVLLEER